MKQTIIVYLGLLVVVFIGQHVSAQEDPNKATEVDQPIGAEEERPSEPLPVVEQKGDIAESPVGSFSSSRDSGSIYGGYNSEDCCYRNGPTAPSLSVNDQSQSEHVRRKIEFMLCKNAAVEQAISKNPMNCEKSHWGSAGLEDNCPSRFLRATEVRYRGNTCYIVRPNQQCVTYRNCRRRRGPCAYGGVITKGTRSFLHGVFRRQISDKGKDPCYGTSMSSSTCLPDGYRTFYVWIYCDYYGFRLINIELPQCCSCKKYNNCYYQ